VSYGTDVGPGTLDVRLYANYLEEFEEQDDAFAEPRRFDGVAFVDGALMHGRPEWMAQLNVQYQIGNLNLAVSEQYIHSMTIDRPGLPNVFVDDSVDAVWYTDLTATYNYQMEVGNLELFATVNNLFDKDPPLIPTTIPGASYPTITNVYDYIGRAFNVGTRFEF
jgi:outer membrane receptor protein involved in Fe transport